MVPVEDLNDWIQKFAFWFILVGRQRIETLTSQAEKIRIFFFEAYGGFLVIFVLW